MIGIFLHNPEQGVCFVQPQDTAEVITAFHYTPDARVITLTLENGEEETITSEIATEIHEGLIKAERILVAHVDDENNAQQEYWSPLTRV